MTYYVGAEAQDYIVMPGLGSASSHRRARVTRIDSACQRLRYPDWLKEGLAEFFRRCNVSESGSELGGDLPARSQLLRRHTWMPLPDLLALPEEFVWPQESRACRAVLRAKLGAPDMLFLSAEYGPRLS